MRINHRILVVDDDELNREVIKEQLHEKYVLAFATNGKEALDLLVTFWPDIILLDIMMPGIDGYEVCRKIRADNRFSFIKILFISAKSTIDERLEGYEAGADDYLTKPVSQDELVAKIKVFLRLKRIEEIDKLKSDLLVLFSHETRTPLNGILGFAELLLHDSSLSPKAQNYIKNIHESGIELQRFVDKTLLLSNLKKGIELSFVGDSVTSYLTTLIENKKRNNPKEITFHFVSEESIFIEADWVLLNKVFYYILENSVKFSEFKGDVYVIVKQINTNTCQIRIKDFGIGISHEQKESLFNEFAIKDLDHHHKGQGLSLAIAKYIILYHNGCIDVESEKGKGSTFIITLPLHPLKTNITND